ncbi:ATP-dependent RNA helicase, partial [Trifolium medium]|nr:ATP-dependent RNA helicase [Trifolium medium]
GKKLLVYPAPYEEVLLLERRVSEAERLAQKEMKESRWKSGGYLGDEDVKKIPKFVLRNHVQDPTSMHCTLF